MDRENVIKGLEDIVDFFEIMSVIEVHCNELKQNAENAIALLKDKKEAVKPIIIPWAENEDGEVTIAKRKCGRCGYQFFTEKPNYCENCGVPILWEDW